MNRVLNRSLLSMIAAAFIAACANLPGSGSDNDNPAENVTSNMEQVDADLRDAVMQVDAVDASIETLLNADTSLNPAFERYARNVEEMERVGEELEQHADALRTQGFDYFAEWREQTAEVSNPDVAEISDQRHEETREAFTELTRSSANVKRTLQTYISDLRDIETYLSNDLTPAGVEAIQPVAEQAQKDGEALQQAIKPMINALNKARSTMDVSSITD
jgi:chromosome segregation ATPase